MVFVTPGMWVAMTSKSQALAETRFHANNVAFQRSASGLSLAQVRCFRCRTVKPDAGLEASSPELESSHNGKQFQGVDVVTELMKNEMRERRVKILVIEETASASAACVGREIQRIIPPRGSLDDRHTIVKW